MRCVPVGHKGYLIWKFYDKATGEDVWYCQFMVDGVKCMKEVREKSLNDDWYSGEVDD
jgi:hypothetical protein